MATKEIRRRPTRDLKGVANEEEKNVRVIRLSGLKAGLVGSVGLLIFLLISLIPFKLLACLVIPGFLIVWTGTGVLAGVLAGDELKTRRESVMAGATAGFVAGIGGGIAAMVVAAFGVLFPALGEGVLAQFSTIQVETLARVGILPETIRLIGSILSTLAACGIGGTLVSAGFGALGGRIYFRVR